jgi:two-component system chemotaxis response regulator CheY
MVTAMGQQSMVIEAIKLGAKDFVVKPFEKSRVYQAIQNVLSQG